MTESNKEQVKSTFRMEDDPADTAKVMRAELVEIALYGNFTFTM